MEKLIKLLFRHTDASIFDLYLNEILFRTLFGFYINRYLAIFTKFSSIVEGRCIVQNVKLESYQANGVLHSHGLEDGEPETLRNIFAEEDPAFAEYWYDSKIKFFNTFLSFFRV